MFFILIAINLILYIASGLSFYNGNSQMGIIYGAIGVLITLFSIGFYKKRQRRRTGTKKGKTSSDCGDCLNCIDIPDCDCGGADCGGCSI